MVRSLLASAAVALALAAPVHAGLAAQVAATTPVIPMDSVQTALARFQVLQEELTALQQDVMPSTPTLAEEQASVVEAVEQAVAEIDPSLQVDLETRMPALQQEAQAAQTAGDTTALVALEQEYMTLMERAESAQLSAVERPQIAARIEAFETALRSAMQARNPAMEETLAELEALAMRLEATLGGG